MEQKTEGWFQARCGLATASRFKDILAKIKSGEAATRRNYKMQLVCERLTGKPQEGYQNGAMQWGTDNEPFARIAYEARGQIVREEGFIKHPDIDAGCSPDGLIEDNGGIEIKCPYQTAVHIETIINGMPPEHMPQVQGAMWITGRTWWDFISYDPRMPESMQLYVQRIERDEDYIATLDKEVRRFLDEVTSILSELQKRAA